ncbi:hypothetical protein [Dokdonella soli]|uniref:Uncharacterized protein n=1 Tax=Dokdonella soli TaxID=529810 RepID=A0ABN1IHH5_9GAMM
MAPLWAAPKAIKNPTSVSGCGVLWGIQVSFALPGHAPSARTSVGNKEYEYKGKKKLAAKSQHAGNRQETVPFGDAAMGVALRHVADPTVYRIRLSTVSFEIFSKPSRSSHLDVQMAGPVFAGVVQPRTSATLERADMATEPSHGAALSC